MEHRFLLHIVFCVVLIFAACRKQISVPVQPHPSTAPLSPQDPMVKLATESSKRIASGIGKPSGDFSLKLEEIANEANFPPAAIQYFRDALSSQMQQSGIAIKDSAELTLRGSLSKREEQIIFAFTVYSNASPRFSDAASILDDPDLQQSLAKFNTAKPPAQPEHIHHRDMPVPSPLVELTEVPLDTGQLCVETSDGPCFLLVLFPDRLLKRNWKDGTEQIATFPKSAKRSRSKTGKIIVRGASIVVLNNSQEAPLFFDFQLRQTRSESSLTIPTPDPGVNSYILADGRFFDFELIESNRMIAIDSQYRLNVASQGSLVVGDRPVGAALSSALPSIYTSAPVLPGEPDAVLQFTFENGKLQFHTQRAVDGEIVDLTVTDLNQDRKTELLVTLKTSRGIFIEVMDSF